MSPRGRGQRTITRSKKARDVEGHVAGIDSAANFVAHDDSSLLSLKSDTSTPKEKSGPVRNFSGDNSATNMNKAKKGAKSAPGSTISGKHKPAVPGQGNLNTSGGEVVNTVNGDNGSDYEDQGPPVKHPRPQTKRSTRVRKPQKKSSTAPRGRPRAAIQQAPRPAEAGGICSSSRLDIYPWEYPRPKDFLGLEESRREWKIARDEREQEDDMDPELDDWHYFPGDPDSYSYSDIAPSASIEFSVARAFIRRAKRAFWTGKSWVEFESEERSTNPAEKAMECADPRQRALLMADVLNNDLRLHIFDQLQIRLCHEIWLEEHPEIDNMAVLDGKIVKKDSVIEGMDTAPSTGGVSAAPEDNYPAAWQPKGVVAPVIVQPEEFPDEVYRQVRLVNTREGPQYVPVDNKVMPLRGSPGGIGERPRISQRMFEPKTVGLTPGKGKGKGKG